MAADWEYHLTWADDEEKANAQLAQYGAAGWELVNGSTTVYRIGDSLNRGVRYRYSLYWRRPVTRRS
jgi:hypothetical protein